MKCSRFVNSTKIKREHYSQTLNCADDKVDGNLKKGHETNELSILCDLFIEIIESLNKHQKRSRSTNQVYVTHKISPQQAVNAFQTKHILSYSLQWKSNSDKKNDYGNHISYINKI